MAHVGERLQPLTVRQRQIVAAIKQRHNVYVIGGKRSGKSTGTAYAAAMLAYHWAPASHGLAFAPTWAQLKDLVLERWQACAPKGLYELCTSGTKELGPHIKVYHPQPAGGAPSTTVIYLRTQEASARIEGLTVGWAWGEEIQDCEEAWDLAGDRISDAACPHLVRFGAGLPEQGWLEDVFEALPDGRYDPDTDTEWIQCTTHDNEAYLPQAYIAGRAKALTEEEYNNRVLGLFVSSSDAVYPTFDRRVHVQPAPFDPQLKVFGGVDFNNRPMTCALLQRRGSLWSAVGDISKPGTTQDHATRIADWCIERGIQRQEDESFREHQVVLIPDASGSSLQHNGKSDHGILRQAGFTLAGPKANPHVKDRDNAVLRALRNKKGESSLVIDPSCRSLIEALSKLRHIGRDRSPYSHLTDCLGYVLHRYAPVEEVGPSPPPVSVARSQASLFRRPGRGGGYPL